MPIEGLDRLKVKLNKLVSEKTTQEALGKACALVEGSAKEYCPAKTGDLRQSIAFEVLGNIGVVGTNLYYAPYVHQGTGIHAKNGDGRKDVPWRYQDKDGKWHSTEGQRPQPFLQDALDENKNNIRKIFKEAIKNDRL